MYSGITSGRVLDGELLCGVVKYIKLEQEIYKTGKKNEYHATSRRLKRNLHETVCR